MGAENQLELLARVESIVGSNVISQTTETKARLFSMMSEELPPEVMPNNDSICTVVEKEPMSKNGRKREGRQVNIGNGGEKEKNVDNGVTRERVGKKRNNEPATNEKSSEKPPGGKKGGALTSLANNEDFTDTAGEPTSTSGTYDTLAGIKHQYEGGSVRNREQTKIPIAQGEKQGKKIDEHVGKKRNIETNDKSSKKPLGDQKGGALTSLANNEDSTDTADKPATTNGTYDTLAGIKRQYEGGSVRNQEQTKMPIAQGKKRGKNVDNGATGEHKKRSIEPATNEKSSKKPPGDQKGGALTSQANNEDPADTGGESATTKISSSIPYRKEPKKLDQLVYSFMNEKETTTTNPLPATSFRSPTSNPLTDVSGNLIKFNSNDVILSMSMTAVKSAMYQQFRKLGSQVAGAAKETNKATDDIFHMFKNGGGRFFKFLKHSKTMCTEIDDKAARNRINGLIYSRMRSSLDWLNREDSQLSAGVQNNDSLRTRKRKRATEEKRDPETIETSSDKLPGDETNGALISQAKNDLSAGTAYAKHRKDELTPSDTHRSNENALQRSNIEKTSQDPLPDGSGNHQPTVSFRCPRCLNDIVFSSTETAGDRFAEHVRNCVPEKDRKSFTETFPDNETKVSTDEILLKTSPVDPHKLKVGARVIVVGKEGKDWQATILKFHTRKGEQGLMIHYDGHKKSKSNFVSFASVVNYMADTG